MMMTMMAMKQNTKSNKGALPLLILSYSPIIMLILQSTALLCKPIDWALEKKIVCKKIYCSFGRKNRRQDEDNSGMVVVVCVCVLGRKSYRKASEIMRCSTCYCYSPLDKRSLFLFDFTFQKQRKWGWCRLFLGEVVAGGK